jgi:uncharacterized protein YceH (UPF0502 family)
MPPMPPPLLSPLEARVLGVLVEKQRTVPDTYPLSLNAIVAGCNQKTSRDPIMSVSDADAQAASDSLKRASLVVESSGGRVMRYAHNAERALALPAQSVALIATLMLRGAQTAGELRINCDRLHRFADISAVEGFLHELEARPAGALVLELPRAPGTRETRWAHLLAGTPAFDAPDVAGAAAAPRPADDEWSLLRDTVAGLQAEVAELRAALAKLRDELGATSSGGSLSGPASESTPASKSDPTPDPTSR